MKRTLIKVTLAALAVVLLGSCEKINQRIDALEERLDGIETEKIASIDSQIASINSSIADLGTIRSNITSLRSQVDDHSTDIFNLEEADRALNDRILNLEDYLDDVLPTYAEKDWVKATFSTLAQYEATCDTIAKIDARIGKLDERLSKEIKACADSMKKWVNVQFEAYYTAAEMDAALSDMQDQIDSLKSGSSEYKLDSLANELTKTKAAVDSAKAQLTREYKAAIDTAITHCEGRLTKALTDAITKVNDDITALTTRVSNLEVFVATLTGRVTDLEGMIQSVTIVPAYSDGSVKVEGDTLYLDCIISPASAVSTLTKANFTVLVNEVLTKAVNIAKISITEDKWFSKVDSKGTVSLKVPIKGYIPETAGKSITVAVNVKNGISDYTTEFVPVANENYYVSLGENYSGDYTLPKTNGSVHIEIGKTVNTVNLKYAEGFKPKNIFIKVVGDDATVAKLTGDLAASHVEFTAGTITNVELTTSASTFVVKKDATITGKLTVNGGNVVLKGATVQAIEVAASATADGAKAPVEIVMEKDGSTTPAVTTGITTKANVVVAPVEGVIVKVTTEDNAKVANGGKGTVTDKDNNPIDTKAAAKIGDIKYITLADAIEAVKEGEKIDIIVDVDKAAGISVPSGKNFTVDFGGHKYAMECPGAGSAATKTAGFQLLKNSTIVFKNGIIKCTDANKDKTWSSGDASKGIAMMIQNYANLTLDSLTIDATNIAHNGAAVRYALSNNCGNVEYKGNTTINTIAGDYAFDVCKYKDYSAPTVTWNSTGKVNGGIELSGGKFVVAKNLSVSVPVMAAEGESTLEIGTGATLSAASDFNDPNPNLTNHKSTAPVQVKQGAGLTISGAGTVEGINNAYSAVVVSINGDDDTKAAKLTVTGNVTLKGNYYGVVGNGQRHNTEITVNGGTIKGTYINDNLGIYHPQAGKLTITGGTIEGYSSAVEVRGGTVNISGGSLTATAPTFTCNANGNGNTTVGAALAIAQHNTKKDISVTITGGTFAGVKALNESNPQANDPAPQVTMSVSGGTFNGEISTADVTGFISGGTFSDLSGVKYVADNATYTLGADVANAAGMTLDTKKTFTVDFGGHTYTVNKPGAGSTNTQTQAFQLIAGQNITFKNGTIKAADANLNATSEGDVKPIKRFIQNYANLTLTNMTFDGTNINGENSVVEFCNGNVTIDGTTNFTAKSGVASINVDSWKGSYPNGTAVTINTTGNVGKIHCYTEGTGSMTTKSSLTIKNGKNITIDDVSNGEVVVSIEGGTFSDLSGVKYIADNKTYTLGADVDNAAGMAIDTKKTFTLDFGGHTYTVNKPGAGSTGTQTMAFQLLKDQTVIFKNGTIKAATENLNATESDGKKPIKRFIQNYANLTLTDMTLDGTNINGNNSVVEFCNGNVLVNGSTNFKAKTDVASINVDSWTDYPNGTNVTINTTGKVGKIYCYSEGSGQMITKSKLTIVSGEDITIEHKTEGDVDVDDQTK